MFSSSFLVPSLAFNPAFPQVSTGPGAVKIIDVGLAKIYDFLSPSTMSVAAAGDLTYGSSQNDNLR